LPRFIVAYRLSYESHEEVKGSTRQGVGWPDDTRTYRIKPPNVTKLEKLKNP
jgi:hypothetical protein